MHFEQTIAKEKRENVNRKEALAEFCKRNCALFFAPLIALCIYVFMLIRYQVYPFGDSTVASYDLSSQICPFVEHFFDVFNGRSTLFYSHAIVGGMDVTGSLMYFIFSPFSFLFFIFGAGRVAHTVGIVMACKLMAVAFSGTWFAKKLFKGIPDYLCVALGLTYTYCGYMFVANTYINWVDFLIYMPFAAAAFIHFVKTEKFLPFALVMACCIYTSFSIACFSMFTVFPLLIAYALLCVEKQRRNMFITKLCLCFFVAVLLALPVLLPALVSYANGARSGNSGLFANLWSGFKNYNKTNNPIELDAKNYLKSFTKSIYAKWTYILSDSIFLLLTLIWFYRNDFKKPFVQFMFLAGVLTLLPTIIDEVMVLMNMGSYMSYALRFGFLNALYFYGGACLCLEGICFQKNTAFDGTPLFSPLTDEIEKESLTLKNAPEKENEGGMYATNSKIADKTHKKKQRIWSGLILGLGFLAFVFLLVFMIDNNYKDSTLWGYFIDSGDLNGLSGFSSGFAHSLGGLPVILVFFVTVAVVAFIGFLLIEKKRISPRLLSYVLVVVVGMQVLFYNQQLVVGNLSTQHKDLDAYTRLCAQLNEKDDTFFRVKDYGKSVKKDGVDKRESLWTANAPLTGRSNSFSVFSSMTDRDNFAVYRLFGYLGNGKNSFKSTHNIDRSNRCEEFGDSFLGYKYYLVPKSRMRDFKEGMKLSKYVKPYMVMGAEGEEVQLSVDNYYVYENEIVFPSAYVLPSGEFRFSNPNETSNSNYQKYNQKALYEFLRGKALADMKEATGSDDYDRVTVETARELSEYLWTKAADIEVTAGRITAHVTGAKAGEALFLNHVASRGYTVRINGERAELIDNDLKFLSVALQEGDNEVVFEYSTPYVKYIAIGAGIAFIGLIALAFVMKSKLVEWLSPLIAWAGIVLAIAVVAVFMLYPSVACLIKFIKFV